MNKSIFSFLFLGLLSSLGFSQNWDKAKLDSYFDAYETHNKIMGSVAVTKDGEEIYKRSIGFADVENKKKADENTKYRIGSITKTFTAALLLKGVEEGKIHLNQTIDTFFSEFPNAEKITVEQLLHHRSGIHNFTSDDAYLNWKDTPKTEQEMIAIIKEGGSDFEPDIRTEYSNSNYVLLTFILQKTFGKSYAEILSEHITKPLGLKNTYVANIGNGNKNESKSYTWRGEWVPESDTDVSIPLGAGAIVSTPTDLVAFSDALFSGKIIKKESIEKMETLKDNYGMGLFPIPFGEKRGWGHSGGIDGFSSVFIYFPEGNVSYALTSNGTNVNNNNISIAVLSAVYGVPFEIPEFYDVELTPGDLDKYIGVYSSSQIPPKITITKEHATLMAQATGQPSFPLEPSGPNEFKFEAAGVVMEFNPTENTLILKQGGGEFTFKRD